MSESPGIGIKRPRNSTMQGTTNSKISRKTTTRRHRSAESIGKRPRKTATRRYRSHDLDATKTTAKIFNINIRKLVGDYMNGRKLPSGLENIEDWDVSQVTSMRGLFKGYSTFNRDLTRWDVSRVKDMYEMFDGCTAFNQPLHNWNVGNVETMEGMFAECTSFNQPLHNWNTGNVRDMEGMFYGCTEFNQPLHNWNTGNVRNMDKMFYSCVKFNHPLNGWNVSRVETMESMFYDCAEFNQSLEKWNTGRVKNMNQMFMGCTAFNGKIHNFDTRNVRSMEQMFQGCAAFNQHIDNWIVYNVDKMQYMFAGCTSFNQPLNEWDFGSLTKTTGMFYGCASFNQPLNDWDVSIVSSMAEMFVGCTSFNQPLHDWVIDEDADTTDMFTNCGISQENLPDAFMVLVPDDDVDAQQIHRESANINYPKLIRFLRERIGIVDNKLGAYYKYIGAGVHFMIVHSTETTPEEKRQQTIDLKRILVERLAGLDYSVMSPVLLEAVLYSIKYATRQPPTFRDNYVKAFLKDCVEAYNGDDGMTCAGGALERVIMSFVPACVAMQTTEDNHPDYENLLKIINAAKLIEEYVLEWYKLHKNGTENEFPEQTTEDEKKANLRAYLLQKLTEEDELVERTIVKYADELGFDKEVFVYGGRRRPRASGKRAKK